MLLHSNFDYLLLTRIQTNGEKNPKKPEVKLARMTLWLKSLEVIGKSMHLKKKKVKILVVTNNLVELLLPGVRSSE